MTAAGKFFQIQSPKLHRQAFVPGVDPTRPCNWRGPAHARNRAQRTADVVRAHKPGERVFARHGRGIALAVRRRRPSDT